MKIMQKYIPLMWDKAMTYVWYKWRLMELNYNYMSVSG